MTSAPPRSDPVLDASLGAGGPGMTPEGLAALAGTRIGTSPWLTVTQPMVDGFADATGDHQFIHIDPVRAADTPFGGTVAHGFLTLSLLPRMIAESDCPRLAGVVMGVNYGCDRLRFVTPVRVGARVRGVFTLVDLAARAPGVHQQTLDVAVEIEGAERPALVARWISLFHTAPDDGAPAAPAVTPSNPV